MPVTSTFDNVVVVGYWEHDKGLLPGEVEALGRSVWRKDRDFHIVKSRLIPHEGH